MTRFSPEWSANVARLAREAGVTPSQYLTNDYANKGPLGMRTQAILEEGKAAVEGWQAGNRSALTAPLASGIQALKGNGGTKAVNNTNTKSTNNSSGSAYEKVIDGLYNRGLLNANQAIKLYDATSKK